MIVKFGTMELLLEICVHVLNQMEQLECTTWLTMCSMQMLEQEPLQKEAIKQQSSN